MINLTRLLLIIMVALICVGPARADQHKCKKIAAYVDSVEMRCDRFKKYRDSDPKPDPRLALRMHLNGKLSRSIAIIVGVSNYPNISNVGSSGDIKNNKLLAAQEDVSNLTKFFTDNQNFDEVIVLENENATEEAIHYFLTKYLIRQSINYGGKTRVVFAYSGHGLQEDKDSGLPARLVLSNAGSEYDLENEVLLRPSAMIFENCLK